VSNEEPTGRRPCWEGFVIQQIIRRLAAARDECFFWATHAGAELDLLVVRGHQRLGFEVKRTSSPRVTPSMKSAVTDLKLRGLDVIHAGEETFPLGTDMRAVPLKRILKDLASPFMISTCKMIHGDIAKWAMDWVDLHRDALMANWQSVMNGELPFKINPLQC
jgi:hypothetical protein